MSDNGTLSKITYKQRKAITALLATRTEREAAVMAGVSLRTIARWLQMPHFRYELRRVGISVSGTILDKTMRRLTEGQTQALDVLDDIMARGKANERRQAAATWLATFRDFKELIDFEERIDKLEKSE